MYSVILQFWNGDIQQAYRLAKFIPAFSDVSNIDLVMFAKFGTDIVEDNIPGWKSVRYVKGKRTGTGWPVGCNCLWHDVTDWLLEIESWNKWNYCFTIEADCCPLKRNWTDLFTHANQTICGERNLAMGWSHINGNLLLKTNKEFLKWYESQEITSAPWDIHYAASFERFGTQDLNDYIINIYNSKKLDYNYLETLDHLWLHGCKDGSCMQYLIKKHNINFNYQDLNIPVRSSYKVDTTGLLVKDNDKWILVNTGSYAKMKQLRKTIHGEMALLVDLARSTKL